MFAFEVTHTDGRARRGVLRTPHGQVETPVFMPVGTAGSVKGVTPAQLQATGAQMILANTYHLQLRPSADVVRDLGGIHRFTGWEGPIFTDSGGFQVFSLGAINKISDEGVTFKSHIDGSTLCLDPRIATEVQNKLGADIITTLDQCPPLPCDYRTLVQAVDRSVRWARACKEVHARDDQALFCIVQGGLDVDLRRRCADRLAEIGFDGYAIGGLSVGETHEEMAAVLEPVASCLPGDRPRHLMGVGTPRDIVRAVQAGVDMFDCVLPTRNGRNSYAFTATGSLKLRNQTYRLDDSPLESGCDCETCRRFSRGYLRHLFLAGEMLGPILASIHNLRFYQRLMSRIRDLIPSGQTAIIHDEFPVVCDEAEPLDAKES